MGCRLWGRTESDTTEATEQQQQQQHPQKTSLDFLVITVESCFKRWDPPDWSDFLDIEVCLLYDPTLVFHTYKKNTLCPYSYNSTYTTLSPDGTKPNVSTMLPRFGCSITIHLSFLKGSLTKVSTLCALRPLTREFCWPLNVQTTHSSSSSSPPPPAFRTQTHTLVCLTLTMSIPPALKDGNASKMQTQCPKLEYLHV